MRLLLFLIIVTLFTSGIHSLKFADDLIIETNGLSETFYKESLAFHKETLNDSDDLVVVESRNITKKYHSEKCLASLRKIAEELPGNMKVAPFLDAWGNIPSGILYGNSFDVGNYDECVGTSVFLDDMLRDVNGQFCVVKIPIREKNNLTVPQTTELNFNIGVCIPDNCSPEVLKPIFDKSIEKVYNGQMKNFANVTISMCKTAEGPDWKAINTVGVTFFGIVGVLMLLSSIYDFAITLTGKHAIPVLLAFSILTNGKKLFAISTKNSPNVIDCLSGIRVLSMAWIMYGHTYMISFQIPFLNTLSAEAWKTSFSYLPVANGTLAVDSFFFLSGLLVAWSGFRELDRTKGKLNIIMMYVHRYIRLTPLVAALMLVLYSLKDIIGDGPLKEGINGGDVCNADNWWPNLLYIQNYYVPEPKCLARSWYLAVDFQLYLIAPFLLIPMWKWGKKFAPVIGALILMSIAYIMTVYIIHGFTDLKGGNPGEWTLTYIPMHTRCSPWLVGFGFGYFMHVNRQRIFRLNRMVQLLAWLVCFFTMIMLVFGTYFSINAYGKGTVIETAIYDGWKRGLWAVALAWITFACHHGFGGLINVFLSHPFWQPLTRLNYAMYLTHALVIRLNASLSRTPVFFSAYDEIMRFWSAFGLTILFSIIMSLAFEAPIIVLEKFIFGQDKPKKAKTVDELPAPGVKREIA